jgi:hypothetical protein
MAVEPQGSRGVDMDEVTRLVEALERDLEKVRSGSGDIETLRAEVMQLRSALGNAPRVDDVAANLHGVRGAMHRAEEELAVDAFRASDYIVRIGRILGLS